MKFEIILLLLALSFFGCKKDNVENQPEVLNYYQSDGNVLIFVIGDTLEATYEYNLPNIQLINDSLPISYESTPDPSSMYQYQYWKFLPNPDTLFWIHPWSFEFMEDQIDNQELFSLNTSLPFDSTEFQLIETFTYPNVLELWETVSHLAIVKSYRDASPTSKIGISRQVLFQYDENLGINVPQEKYLIILAKE